MSDEYKPTGGPVCPGCGSRELINEHGHRRWGCWSHWGKPSENSMFIQSDWCQRYELDTLRKAINDIKNLLAYQEKEQKRQDALIYQAPCGQRLKD